MRCDTSEPEEPEHPPLGPDRRREETTGPAPGQRHPEDPDRGPCGGCTRRARVQSDYDFGVILHQFYTTGCSAMGPKKSMVSSYKS